MTKKKTNPQKRVKEATFEEPSLVFSRKAFAALVKMFDAPARPNPRLRRTMNTKAPWE